MRSENIGVGGMDAKAGRTASAPTPAVAPQAGVPATPAGELDEWEMKVVDELKSLKSLWENYKRKHLTPAIAQARALNTREAIDKAVNMETYVDMIESLFIEAEIELEDEVESRQQGDNVNMVNAAKRVNETLAFLRVYAARWEQ
jgi:hypothetical protein